MLKWDERPQYKALRAVQWAFSRASKQVIIDLRPTVEGHHLLIGLKDVRTLKMTLEKKGTKESY